MWDHHTKYRETKIELESLIQELQKELEKLKTTCLINTEKIGYNYQVGIRNILKSFLHFILLWMAVLTKMIFS